MHKEVINRIKVVLNEILKNPTQCAYTRASFLDTITTLVAVADPKFKYGKDDWREFKKKHSKDEDDYYTYEKMLMEGHHDWGVAIVNDALEIVKKVKYSE